LLEDDQVQGQANKKAKQDARLEKQQKKEEIEKAKKKTEQGAVSVNSCLLMSRN
jgi:hypothetical protein